MLHRDQTQDIKSGIASLSSEIEYISGRLLQGELLDRYPSRLFCKYSPLAVGAPLHCFTKKYHHVPSTTTT